MREKKLILLDKDGTLTAPKSGKEFVQSPTDQVILPGALSQVRMHFQNDAQIVIVSNQGGIAAGHKTVEDTVAEMLYCMELFNGRIHLALFCPDFKGEQVYLVFPDGTHAKCGNPDRNYRKPGAGMIQHEAFDRQLSQGFRPYKPDECFMVGDRPEDAEAANAAGIDFLHAEEWRNH